MVQNRVETITDSWKTIMSNPRYAEDYKIGDTKYLDIEGYGKCLMQIIDVDCIKPDGEILTLVWACADISDDVKLLKHMSASGYFYEDDHGCKHYVFSNEEA